MGVMEIKVLGWLTKLDAWLGKSNGLGIKEGILVILFFAD